MEKIIYKCSPQSIEHKIRGFLEYYNVEAPSELDDYLFDIEENRIELTVGGDGEIEKISAEGYECKRRHTYTDAFDTDLDELVEYLEKWFNVKFRIVNF